METLAQVKENLKAAQENRKGIVAQIETLTELEANGEDGLTDEQKAQADELLTSLEEVETELAELRQKETELEEKQVADATRTERLKAAVAKKNTPVGRRVPTASGFIGGDGASESTAVIVHPPNADELRNDLGTVIRAVALAGANPQAAADIARDVLGNERVYAAMSAGDFAAGGAWIPENYVPQLVELLRPRSVIRSMGAQNPPLVNGSLTLPKITQGANASYIGENVDIPTSELKGGQLVLRSKKLVAMVPVSNDLLRYSNPSADTIVRNDLVRSMAIAEDAAFLRDDGSGNAPKGLRYWAPTANVIAANATVNLQNVTNDLGKLELALQNANVGMTNIGYIMAPRTANYLRNLRDGNGNYAFPEMQQGMLRGYRVALTTQVPINLGGGSNESEIYFADFDEVIIAEDSRIQLEASSVAAYHDGTEVVAAFSRDQTVIRVIAQHDLGLRHAEACAILTEVVWI